MVPHLVTHPHRQLEGLERQRMDRAKIGGGIGRVMKLGFQPVNLTAQFYGNAVYPSGGSSWSMRLQIAFLFPKLTKEQEKLILEKKLKQLEKEGN